MRLEMEDVVMRAAMLSAFFDASIDVGTVTDPEQISFNETFAKSIILVGQTYVVDKITGNRKIAYITFFNFLPDSVTDITMESEGDIGMIGLNGELFANVDGNFFTISETLPIVAPATGLVTFA